MILFTILSHSGSPIGRVFVGMVLLALGSYFLLRNTFGFALPPIDWDLVWPVIVIVSGIGLLWRELAQRSSVERATDERPPPEAAS